MLIKKQVSYIPSVVVDVFIAKVDYIDGHSQFTNYGFVVEGEETEVEEKNTKTVTLALENMRIGDIFVICKKPIFGKSNIRWYLIKEQDAYKEITKDTAYDEYQGAIDDRANTPHEYIHIEDISTEELKRELNRRYLLLQKQKEEQKAANYVMLRG